MPGPFLGTAPAPGTVPQWPQPRRKSGDAMAVENWTWTQDDPGFFASTVDTTYPTSVEGKHEDPRWGQIWGLQMAGCTFPTDGSTLDGPNCWVYFYIGSIMFCWCVYIYIFLCVFLTNDQCHEPCPWNHGARLLSAVMLFCSAMVLTPGVNHQVPYGSGTWMYLGITLW